ncbi:RidA family protein [Salmonella enterica subsp. enterica]|nr:RidA family protein [Salmonella enterica subsp. enterica serovar Budapest]
MKVIINTDKAPSAIGPYSQGFIFNGLVFTSGQLPLYPKTMNLTEGGIKEQTWRALLNLKFVLEMGGASLETVLKTTCFLKNMDDFNAFNEVYETFFGKINGPARSCIQVEKIPKDALVEIEAIAFENK